MGFVVLKKRNILSVAIWQCTEVLNIPFCFSEQRVIDLPGNKPLLLLQLTSERTVQHSNSFICFFDSNNQFIKDQAENTLKKHVHIVLNVHD